MNDEEIIKFVSPYTLCSEERIQNVLNCIQYIVDHDIEGDFVEVGVFRGGIIMAMALKCIQLGVKRTIYAYDTFSGMTEPTEEDENLSFIKASDIMSKESEMYDPGIYCISQLDETKRNVEKTKYTDVVYCIGDVVQTDKEKIPKKIAILRLDTDWYESTKFELEEFEPTAVSEGDVIIDDFGPWVGSQKAVTEFLKKNPYKFAKIDYTGIFWQKYY